MNKYTYIVEPLGIEISAVAATQKEAHHKAFQSLTNEQQDACACLDWVDTEPAAQAA